MTVAKQHAYQLGTSEPAVRLCQIDTVEDSYALLLVAMEFDTKIANVIWGLLFDQADVVATKTSSRRLANILDIPVRSSARTLVKLMSSGLLRLHGRSYVDVRYRLETEVLVKQWMKTATVPECFTDQDRLLGLCENWDLEIKTASPSIILLCQLGYDYPLFAVLSALIRLIQDDDDTVSASCRSLAEAVSLPSMTVHRTLCALEEQGLIERQDTSSKTACYRVCLDVLRALLVAPLPDVDVLPGITPLPALQRLFPATPTTGGSQ